jgi:hypothetical protein
MESIAIGCILRVPGRHAVLPSHCSVASRSVSLPDTTVGSVDGLIHMAGIDSSWYIQVHDDGRLYVRPSWLSRRGLGREVVAGYLMLLHHTRNLCVCIYRVSH